jgi:hypothetical protein
MYSGQIHVVDHLRPRPLAPKLIPEIPPDHTRNHGDYRASDRKQERGFPRLPEWLLLLERQVGRPSGEYIRLQIAPIATRKIPHAVQPEIPKAVIGTDVR